MQAHTALSRSFISCRATLGAPVGPTSRLAHLPLCAMTTASKLPWPLFTPAAGGSAGTGA
jgi:hypothetical protein